MVKFVRCSFISLLIHFDWFVYIVYLILFQSSAFFTSKLCRFVRREKQIAESRFEIAQEEILRYRLRTESLERELSEVQDSMKASRERMEVCADV